MKGKAMGLYDIRVKNMTFADTVCIYSSQHILSAVFLIPSLHFFLCIQYNITVIHSLLLKLSCVRVVGTNCLLCVSKSNNRNFCGTPVLSPLSSTSK